MSTRRNKKRRSLLSRLMRFTVSCAAIALIGAFVFYLFLRTQSLPATAVSQTSYILDMHGQVIHSFNSGQNRHIVALNQMSPHIVNATLAIEDHRFYRHPGVDIRGIARAIAVDIKHMAKVQGASTLTQQLARNLYLNHDRTWARKIKEGVFALQLEMRYSKDEILEQYLNTVYYGHSTYGVQAAARLYYGKNADELTLAESALLAGVPKGAKYFSPYMDMDNAKSRQLVVLNTMAQRGYITRAEADAAAEEQLVFLPLAGGGPSEAPYFRDYIRHTELERLGITGSMLQEGGIRVYTTLDLRMQRSAEEAVAAHLGEDEELQAALVAIDPRTGYIKAMVGGVNYKHNQYNRTLATSRQPGSSFKPIVYLAALATGEFTATTRFKSEPTAFPYDEGRQTYMPKNFNNKYTHDWIDMRYAIAHSDNIYAVSTLLQTGAERVVDMAQALGITARLQPLPSLALGTFPVSPLEMASAYGTIANLGEHVEPTAVLRIEDSRGRSLYEHKPVSRQAVAPSYAYVLTYLMESVFEPGGTASRVASRINRPVAGKTGTTNSDGWMVGFTPELSAAVWVGHDQGRAIAPVESHKAAPIFADFLESALEPVPPKIFPIPEGVVSVYIDAKTGTIATSECPDSRLEVFARGTEPTQFCSAHGAADGGEAAEPAADAQAGPSDSWWLHLKRWWNEE